MELVVVASVTGNEDEEIVLSKLEHGCQGQWKCTRSESLLISHRRFGAKDRKQATTHLELLKAANAKGQTESRVKWASAGVLKCIAG
jgi:hypothetical protein